jgi:hypothetical protein
MECMVERMVRPCLIVLVLGCAAPDASPPASRAGTSQVSTVYAPQRIDPSRNPQFYAMTVRAHTDGDFVRRHAAARAAGPGGLLPPGVTVDGWLELEGLARLRSSVTGGFGSFRLEIDGVTVADLERGLNATVATAGNGWSTLVVDLPADLVLPGTPFSLVQRREGAASDLEVSLEF